MVTKTIQSITAVYQVHFVHEVPVQLNIVHDNTQGGNFKILKFWKLKNIWNETGQGCRMIMTRTTCIMLELLRLLVYARSTKSTCTRYSTTNNESKYTAVDVLYIPEQNNTRQRTTLFPWPQVPVLPTLYCCCCTACTRTKQALPFISPPNAKDRTICIISLRISVPLPHRTNLRLSMVHICPGIHVIDTCQSVAAFMSLTHVNHACPR